MKSLVEYYTPEIIILISLSIIVLLTLTAEPMTAQEIIQYSK